MTSRRQKQRKKATHEEFKVITQNLSGEFSVEPVSASIMKMLEGRVSPELQKLMELMLLGFNDEMQLEIADNLLDFACGHVIHTTGCLSADCVLKACYMWIAEEHGLDTEQLFDLLTGGLEK